MEQILFIMQDESWLVIAMVAVALVLVAYIVAVMFIYLSISGMLYMASHHGDLEAKLARRVRRDAPFTQIKK